VRTVREDPEREDLLFAGTEFGVFVSFDRGAHWQSLQLDLPITPVTGLRVHEGDLVISTQGRSFWILDDITPLRELADDQASETRLFTPRTAWRANMGGSSGDTPLDTAPQGATLHYSLSAATATMAADSPLRLEIVDSTGTVVRTLSSEAEDAEDDAALPAKAGLNRFVWDLQHESPRVPDDVQVWGYDGGPKATPGSYRVRLTAPGETDPASVTLEAGLEVRLDPRLDDVTDEQLAEQLALAIRLRDTMQQVADSIVAVRSAREQIEAAAQRAAAAGIEGDIATTAKRLVEELTAIEAQLYQPAATGTQDLFNYEPQLTSEYAQVYNAVTGPDGYISGGPDRQPTRGAIERTADLDLRWASVAESLHGLLTDEIAAFNALLAGTGVPGVVLHDGVQS